MKKYLKVALAGVCMAAMLALAVGCSTPSQNSSDKETTVEFDGGTLTYAKGDLTVKVDGNATTGYEWTSTIEGSAAKDNGNNYEAPSGNTAGQGGVHTFKYTADGSGEATITLKYARSWETSGDDKTVTIKVTAENGAFTKAAVA